MAALAFTAAFGAASPSAAQEGTIWDMEPAEEVTAIHEDDDSGGVGYAYVFYDEFFDFRRPLGPHIPGAPTVPPPQPDPCAEALADYFDALIFHQMATEALGTLLGQQFVQRWTWRTEDGRYGSGYTIQPGDPEWQALVDELTEQLEQETRQLEQAAAAVTAACQQS